MNYEGIVSSLIFVIVLLEFWIASLLRQVRHERTVFADARRDAQEAHDTQVKLLNASHENALKDLEYSLTQHQDSGGHWTKGGLDCWRCRDRKARKDVVVL
jgi:hypothetical protein